QVGVESRMTLAPPSSLVGMLTLASNPVEHVVNQHFMSGNLFGIHGVWIWSAHVGSLILAGLLTILLLWYTAAHVRTGPESLGHDRYITRNPLAHMIEVVISYLRETSIRPV